MYVVSLRATLRLPHAASLKDKRAVLRSVKARVANELEVRLVEVDAHDEWQRAVLGCAVVSATLAHAHQLVDDVTRQLHDVPEGSLVRLGRHVWHWDASERAIAPDAPDLEFDVPQTWLDESPDLTQAVVAAGLEGQATGVTDTGGPLLSNLELLVPKKQL